MNSFLTAHRHINSHFVPQSTNQSINHQSLFASVDETRAPCSKAYKYTSGM